MTINDKELHSLLDTAAWTTGLCDCCGTPGGLQLCCTTWWCTCWQFGLNAERFEPGEVVCGGSKCGACMAYMGGMVAVNALDYMLAGVDLLGLTALGVNATFMLAVLPALLMQWQMRNRIRQKYGIKGHPLLDALTVCCCHQCALCQEARELAWRAGQR